MMSPNIHMFDPHNLPESAFEMKVTVDHEEIQRWAEERNGHPARVKGLVLSSLGHLCIDFGGNTCGNKMLTRIPWEDFFTIFEDDGLAFMFQEYMKDGISSLYFTFVSRREAHK